MSLNAKDVSEILKALEASSFDSLDLEIGAVKLSLRRSGAAPGAVRVSGDAPEAASATAAPREGQKSAPSAGTPTQHASATGTSPGTRSTVPAPPDVPSPPGAIAVPAPLLGVFYRAPKPGEPPYVEVGDRVAPDTIIGIIEVMKLMNTVRAGVSGQIVAIPARNGELIEFGATVIHVHPD